MSRGELICSDKHVARVQESFKRFQEEIHKLTNTFLNAQIDTFRSTLGTVDEHNRNPIHYATLDKFTKCILVIKYLLNYEINLTEVDKFVDLFNEV